MALFIIHRSQNQVWRKDKTFSLSTKGFMITLEDNVPNYSCMTWGKFRDFCPEGRSVIERAREELKLHNLMREYMVSSPDNSMVLRVVEVFDEPSVEPMDISSYIKVNGIQVAEFGLTDKDNR